MINRLPSSPYCTFLRARRMASPNTTNSTKNTKKATTIPTVASRNTSPATTTDVTPAMIHLKKSGMGEYSNRLR